MHGNTYMANPLACSAANASKDLFEKEDRLVQVKNIEKKIYDKLFELNSLRDVNRCKSERSYRRSPSPEKCII